MINTTKCAIVTGGASGIGWDTAITLWRSGWRVWVLDTQAPAETLAGSRSDDISYIECDVSDPSSVHAAFACIKGRTEKIDALICSAGVHRAGPLVDHTPHDVDVLLNVNVKGPWLTVREALPLLKASASPENPSRVVFVGSISAIRPKVGAGFYAASKAALHVLAGVLAAELAPSYVLVNAVAPGTVRTPMTERPPEHGALFKASGVSPLGRVADPEDVTKVIMFFLGDAAAYVTGTVLPVDGGTRAAFIKH